ncbi:PTS sugar transporter subunit IIB [Vibrio scophthalmi]|uniref:Protein-N(Pi)-phosphohistidine--sugar phosphotransferase n=3 Tax=Vibrio TaxID=662 RepID=A0A1B1NPM5_9VIBR|nr:PTS sugar transporter subunit IIB [Vibrio scophthalmi]ANS85635.1 Protein-N(pi)-phosphohistidine--sugar phosphotransferase [Vibrio scophthalmi]ANU36612.1 Protein-N(pi)-phosphohistidine--sugar phosphotransferase [Vibrio scophthalmi]EGU30926.1 putative PTS system, cellobiose-specific iibcomponent [Vibrio scophthalmi LMG 19158]MCY9804894.1 PTS sugar transporter subunit IIB [Vibrio scophthalmi]
MKIFLCCAAGMSTSMLVTKMEKAAENNDIPCQISAHSVSEFEECLAECDVCLVAPQVKFKYEEFKREADAVGKGCGLIDMMNYGMLNGEAVLNQAISLYESR